MATHSSTLVWKIPWTEEPGRIQSMGSQRVGHDRVIHFHLQLKIPEMREHFYRYPLKKKKCPRSFLISLMWVVCLSLNQSQWPG